MIFFCVSFWYSKIFKHCPDFFGDCFACLYLFNYLISEFAHLWRLGRKEATRQAAPVSGILYLFYFSYFLHFRICKEGSEEVEVRRPRGKLAGCLGRVRLGLSGLGLHRVLSFLRILPPRHRHHQHIPPHRLIIFSTLIMSMAFYLVRCLLVNKKHF